MRVLALGLIVLAASGLSNAQDSGGVLGFGQIYGTAGFVSSTPGGTMAEAPAVVLVFTAANGQKNLTLTQATGDFLSLLEQGRYCLSAFTRVGKRMQLAKNQLKCVDVKNGKDTRLDVMLLRQ